MFQLPKIYKLDLWAKYVLSWKPFLGHPAGDHQELLNQLGQLNVRQLFSLHLGVFVFKAINRLIPDQSIR